MIVSLKYLRDSHRDGPFIDAASLREAACDDVNLDTSPSPIKRRAAN
jgi:hypothetical protein